MHLYITLPFHRPQLVQVDALISEVPPEHDETQFLTYRLEHPVPVAIDRRNFGPSMISRIMTYGK